MDYELNVIRIKFVHYILLLSVSAAWLYIVCLGYDWLLAKVFMFALNKYLNKLASVRISSASFSFFPRGFRVYLRNAKFCVKNVCECRIENVTFQIRNNEGENSKIKYLIQFSNFKLAILKLKAVDSQLMHLEKIWLKLTTWKLFMFILSGSVLKINNAFVLLNADLNANLIVKLNIKQIKFSYFKCRLERNELNTFMLLVNDQLPKSRIKNVIYRRKEFDDLESGVKILNEPVNSLLFGFSGVRLALSEDITQLFEIERFRLQLTFSEHLPLFESSNFKPSLILDANIEKKAEVNLKLDEKELSDLIRLLEIKTNKKIFFKIQFEDVDLNIIKKDERLCCVKLLLKRNVIKCIIDSEILDFNASLCNVKFETLFTELFQLNSIRLSLNRTENKLILKVANQNISTPILNYFQAEHLVRDWNFLFYILSQLDLLLNNNYSKNTNFTILCCLGNSLFCLPINCNDLIKINLENVSFKLTNDKDDRSWQFISHLDKIKLSTSLNLFSNLIVGDDFEMRCENVCIESFFSVLDTKLQALTTPILIGSTQSSPIQYLTGLSKKKSSVINNTESNVTMNSYQSFLYTHVIEEKSESSDEDDNEKFYAQNCFYLSVLQFRYQSFKTRSEEDSCTYSNQSEFVLGDLFGSIRLQDAFKLANLIYSIYGLVLVELEMTRSILNTFFKESRAYTSTKLLTSLFNVHFLDLDNYSSNFF